MTPEQARIYEQERTALKKGGATGGVSNWLELAENSQLKQALETAATASQWIKPEQDRIYALLDESKNETERNARLFQIEYVEKYLKRAEEIARKRLEYFKNIKSESAIEAEKALIKSDIAHWFEYYAWGYDPRARTQLSIVPFALFPKQKEMVEWLNNLVFYQRNSGLIEKARDEGATETIVRWGTYHWLYTNGFSMLLSTRKEDEVDAKKNQNTLFERIRYQIRLLPSWQYPKDFDVERSMLSTMKLANPENGNTLLGEAPVENMGRGGRVTCAMLDEFAFWSFAGYPQFRSLSQTTDSIIMPSSVAGRLNQYADIAFDGVTPKFTLDWRDNPFKDKRWYDALPFGYISPKMSKTTVAQEVDRNYDAAQPGKVWKCPEPYVFITQSEFLRPFEKAGMDYKFFDSKGKFKIPDDWRVVRTSDYGKSQGHDWSYVLGAQPKETYPLADTHFIFVARVLEPTGLLTAEAVKLWREWEREYGLRDASDQWLHKPVASYNSHEQDGNNKVEGENSGLRKVLLEKYGEQWHAWTTGYQAAIETIEEWWTPDDLLEPNPFRPELYGRCKLVFVAPDGEYQLAFNERLNSRFVTISESEAGFNLARKQISAYHYPMSELGKAKKDMKPEKDFDDIVDAIRGYAINWNRTPVLMSDFERSEDRKPAALRLETIERQKDKLSDEEIGRRYQDRNVHDVLERLYAGSMNKDEDKWSKFRR